MSDSGGAPPMINLGLGHPSADLLPVDLLRRASEAFFGDARPSELSYGTNAGDARFLESLAVFLSGAYGSETDADSLFLTGGCSQGLDLVCSVFTEPGDTVFVEEPTYFLAYQIFRDHGLNIVGIEMDSQGLDIGALQDQLGRHRPALLYTIPSFHNPAGVCLGAGRRRRLVELSREHGFLIAADEVYHLLHYDGPPPPPLGNLIDAGTVLSLGSFSKILAPGMRLGWIQTCASLRQRLVDSGFVASGGSVNHYTSHIVRHAMDLGLLSPHVNALREAYGARVAAMDEALAAHFGTVARWHRPRGGYFFWLQLAMALDTRPLRARAMEQGTGFQPGPVFSSRDHLRNCLRLSFARYDAQDIRTGVERLRTVFD